MIRKGRPTSSFNGDKCTEFIWRWKQRILQGHAQIGSSWLICHAGTTCGKRLSRHLTLQNNVNNIVTGSNKSDATALLMESGRGRIVGTDLSQSLRGGRFMWLNV